MKTVYARSKENDMKRVGNNLKTDELLKHEDIIRYIKTQRTQWIGHLERDGWFARVNESRGKRWLKIRWANAGNSEKNVCEMATDRTRSRGSVLKAKKLGLYCWSRTIYGRLVPFLFLIVLQCLTTLHHFNPSWPNSRLVSIPGGDHLRHLSYLTHLQALSCIHLVFASVTHITCSNGVIFSIPINVVYITITII